MWCRQSVTTLPESMSAVPPAELDRQQRNSGRLPPPATQQTILAGFHPATTRNTTHNGYHVIRQVPYTTVLFKHSDSSPRVGLKRHPSHSSMQPSGSLELQEQKSPVHRTAESQSLQCHARIVQHSLSVHPNILHFLT